MTMEYRVGIHSEPDATRAVMQARRSAKAAGFDSTRVSLLGTVASELVRNILELLKKLLRHGARVNVLQRGGSTAILQAAANGQLATLRLMLATPGGAGSNSSRPTGARGSRTCGRRSRTM